MNAYSPLSPQNWRRLLIALIVSGSLNVGVLGLWVYWITHELPPKPYCELQPATKEQQSLSLADQRGCAEVITQLQKLPFYRLIDSLNRTQVIENGFTERDLTLSCIVAFHDFDLKRALINETFPLEKRHFDWKHLPTGKQVTLTVYPGLTDRHFQAIQQFAQTERWPLTSERIYALLHKQWKDANLDPSLTEAFMLTPEFWTANLLFQRTEYPVRKQQLLEILLEGNWSLLQKSVEQQKQLNDVSDARRQKFLLDYIKVGSESAALLMLLTDKEFATKKLEDSQVITLLQMLNKKTLESESYAKEMLVSPRSTGVWQQASLRLYEYAGESIPTNWNYETTLARFIPGYVTVNAESKEKKIPQVAKQSINPTQNIIKTPPPKKVPSDIATKNSQIVRHYIIQDGDSLWKISRRFGVDMEVLKHYNQLQSSSIKPGTILKIP